MPDQFVCWSCGAPVDGRSLRYRRLEQCGCGVELHVCRMCEHYSPRLPGGCSEDRAEEVMDKERANFCDYFAPRPGAYAEPDRAGRRSARAALDRLFDSNPEPDTTAQQDDDAARRRLNDLFEE